MKTEFSYTYSVRKVNSIRLNEYMKSKPLKDHSDDTYEVDLIIKGEMTVEKEIMFLIEGNYSGVFTLKNVPNDVLDKILLIECPKLLDVLLRIINFVRINHLVKVKVKKCI